MCQPCGTTSSPMFDLWRSAPGTAGVFVDFDGTLAPIVTDPELSRPLSGVTQLLGALAAKFAVVAVVSGRPAAFLVEHVSAPGVLLSGQYGLETVRHGHVEEHPDATRWRSVVAAVATRAKAEVPPGVGVEPKGLALTIHVRAAPEHERWVRSWAFEVAAATDLVVHQARRSYELRPPVGADKGTVVEALAAGLAAVCFLGDDVGDLPAFAALDRLAGAGVTAVRVAVNSDEAPPGLLAAADVIVEGPLGVRDLLAALAKT